MASPELEFGRGSAIPPQKSICDLNLILISSIFSKKVLRFLSHNNIFVIEKLENGTKIDEDGASKQKGGGLMRGFGRRQRRKIKKMLKIARR